MIKGISEDILRRVYDFSDMTNEELRCKFFQKLQECIDLCNNTSDIVEWLKNEGLENEVNVLLSQWLEDGTLEELINIDKINKINNRLDHITIIMPPPSTVEENTKNLQNILNKAKDGNINLTVQILGGYYELKSCIIYDNTTIKMTNKTTLKNVATTFYNPETQLSQNIPILFMNAKPFDEDDSNITKYNGRSNIVIDGGTLETISAFLLSHGQNIVIKNVTFKNCDSDHYIQIASCKNVKIQNCKFIGTTERNSSRQYVEFVQIDWMTNKGQPCWVSSASIFDSSVNDGIEIDGCEFITGCGQYEFMYTCVGSHSSDGDNKNKNIIIRNCKFTGYSYSGLTIDKMRNVLIENNIFTDTKGTTAITITDSENVIINPSNRITGGKRGIYCKSSTRVKIDGVLMENINADSDFILLGECTNVELNRVHFINCNTLGNNVLLRNCNDINAESCRDENTTTTDGYFFRAYTKNDGVSERIRIKNTITTNKKEFRASNTTKIIASIQEELWSGVANSGEIVLNDDISKFKNLKIRLDLYGKVELDLNFASNVARIREFNLRDNTSESYRINFIEVQLTLSEDNTKITINHINQLDINNAGQTVDVENITKIYRITGERVYY